MVFPKDYSWGRFSLSAAVSQGHRIIWIPSATGRNKGLYGKIQVLKPTQQKNCGTMFLPLFKCKSWCFGILSFKYLFLLQECFYYVILHMHDDDKDKTQIRRGFHYTWWAPRMSFTYMYIFLKFWNVLFSGELYHTGLCFNIKTVFSGMGTHGTDKIISCLSRGFLNC